MTELLFMNDFEVEDCQAVVLSVNKTEDGRVDIILNKTCFYPRGGGQDWDEGNITKIDAAFSVEEVRLDENSNVHHIGSITQGSFSEGDSIDATVDHERRLINTRLHSAGHVIDMAIDKLGIDWVATKGQHYPHLSAVEYQGTWRAEEVESLKSKIESTANELIKKGSNNSLKFMNPEEMRKVCKNVPENLPKNKPGRVVMYGESFGIPCGGTHLRDIKNVGKLTVTKLKQKKGVIRLSYAIL